MNTENFLFLDIYCKSSGKRDISIQERRRKKKKKRKDRMDKTTKEV